MVCQYGKKQVSHRVLLPNMARWLCSFRPLEIGVGQIVQDNFVLKVKKLAGFVRKVVFQPFSVVIEQPAGGIQLMTVYKALLKPHPLVINALEV